MFDKELDNNYERPTLDWTGMCNVNKNFKKDLKLSRRNLHAVYTHFMELKSGSSTNANYIILLAAET